MCEGGAAKPFSRDSAHGETSDCDRRDGCGIVFSSRSLARGADNTAPAGFVSLFNGKDFTGWKVPDGDGGHWKVVDGVIDYDAGSQSKGTRTSGATASTAISSCRSIGGSRRRRSSTRTSLISCPTARTPRTFMARNYGFRCPTPIRACFFAATVTIKSTSGAGRSARARCTAFAPTRKHRPSCGPPPRPATRPTSRWANGTISRSPSEARRSRSP